MEDLELYSRGTILACSNRAGMRKENPLATATGSPSPGQAQACFCDSGRSVVLGAAQRAGWLR
jgi:hypothetical protein